MNYIDSKALEVKKQIEKDINTMTVEDIILLFTKSLTDNRATSFIDYYNKTVLDKETINFGEFKRQWAIQGMKKYIYQDFDNHFQEREQEIIREKDITSFYNKYCRTERNEAAFCCKLFHTILPNEFPPLDNPIRKHFKLQRNDFIESLLIVKKAYELFIRENQVKIKMIRDNLNKPRFKILRVTELSNLRLLDMYYWLKISRNNKF
ncbi:MAG: hypothetical protein E3J83_06310 [Candidatus Atribacteria bacterium]|nr:MAG: hypothetical protein E3J83_06310 [Candidatus Atribacteria bacterium]